jgi:hypothetical protein
VRFSLVAFGGRLLLAFFIVGALMAAPIDAVDPYQKSAIGNVGPLLSWPCSPSPVASLRLS